MARLRRAQIEAIMQRVLGELELLEEVDGWELTVSKTRCDTNVEV